MGKISIKFVKLDWFIVKVFILVLYFGVGMMGYNNVEIEVVLIIGFESFVSDVEVESLGFVGVFVNI